MFLQDGEIHSFTIYNNEITSQFAHKNHHVINTKESLKYFLHQSTNITFNGINYDNLVVDRSLKDGVMNVALKHMTDDIIQSHRGWWVNRRKYDLDYSSKYDNIDIMQLPIGMASLKTYGARLGHRKLQELPIDPMEVLNVEQAQIIYDYCINDVKITELLYNHCKPAIAIREQIGTEYNIDVRHKSDAQIAEAIINVEYGRRHGFKPKKAKYKAGQVIRFKPRDYIKFKTPYLQDVLQVCIEAEYKLSAKVKLTIPRKVGKLLTIGDKKYKLGIGGLHSVDKPGIFHSGNGRRIFEIDVGSMYPVTIKNGGEYPKAMGAFFFEIYNKFIKQRLSAKERLKVEKNLDDKTKSYLESLIQIVKIILNGLYGKFGSPYSIVFAPELLLYTAMTGQLSLLMLIEEFHLHGIPVLSGNTDGIVLDCDAAQEKQCFEIVNHWEQESGYTMEQTVYKTYARRDVNSYFALKENGKIKRKGLFKKYDIGKNQAFNICQEAVINKILYDQPIEETIIDDQYTIDDYVMLTKVTGGAHKDGEHIGNVVRFYRSTLTDTPINYVKNDNKVGSSDCCIPIMDYDSMTPPLDIDYQFYVDRACELYDKII